MINTQEEQLITLDQAIFMIPSFDGKKFHRSTLWRWCRKGLGGIQLEYVRVGRRICTTEKALWRFFNNLADRDRDELV